MSVVDRVARAIAENQHQGWLYSAESTALCDPAKIAESRDWLTKAANAAVAAMCDGELFPMSDEIDHERWRRFAAFSQPNHPLAQPYLDAVGRMEKAETSLRAICEIAAEPGEAGAMKALKEAQRIAAEALPAEPNVIPFPK